MALPCFRYYYYASQLIPIMYWLDGEYKARWKEIEDRLTPKLPLQSIIADRGLATKLEEVKTPWINCTMKIWHKVVKLCELHNVLNLFR